MLLKDDQLNQQLESKGFIKVPFFDDQALAEIRNFYNEIHHNELPPNLYDGIHMTTWCSDKDYKQKVKVFLEQKFLAPTNLYFKDYRSMNHVLIVKIDGQETEFKIHQDWSVVDEHQFQSVNIWVPIYDVDENNGALWLVEGSHNLNQRIRGGGILFPEYPEVFKAIEHRVSPIPMKAGEALIFYHSLLHGSPPNVSGKPRIIAVNSIVPKSAPLRVHFQKDSQSLLEVYEPADDFVYMYEQLRTDSLIMPPPGKLVEKFPSYALNTISSEEVIKYLD